MKRFQAEYSENSITYWPIYEAGKIGKIFLFMLGALLIATFILILLNNPSSATFWGIMVILPLVVAALYYALSYISRTMYTKIVVSTEGIVFFKNNNAIEQQRCRGEVSAVYFSQDPWYGRKTCRIFFKKEQVHEPCEKDRPNFVLPISSVDEQKLQKLIPNDLWGNNPHWI